LAYRHKKYTKEQISLWRQGKLKLEIPCITCGEDFVSDGAHMRMCQKCKANNRNVINEYGHILVEVKK